VISIDPVLLLLLVGCLYVLVFGALSFIRREGLSVQFALEAAVVTAVVAGGAWLFRLRIGPVALLLILYVVTQRSRLLVDVANLAAARGRFATAFRLYRLALVLRPDAAGRLVVLTNRGVAELLSGQIEASIATLESVLQAGERPHLGVKYEAACRYNLGKAFEKRGDDSRAVKEYNEVLDLLPGSVYAQAAQVALRRRQDQTHSG